jgi:hypothetical protein
LSLASLIYDWPSASLNKTSFKKSVKWVKGIIRGSEGFKIEQFILKAIKLFEGIFFIAFFELKGIKNPRR